MPIFAIDSDSSFSDVEESAWYTEAISYCIENDLIEGTSNTTFSPNSEADRVTVVTALYRKAGSPDIEETAVFTDVPLNAPYNKAITWSNATDIISGYEDGRFGVDDAITREQLVTMLWRMNHRPAPQISHLSFEDANSISNYAIEAVNWAKEQGIISGKSQNLFDPTGHITRAELAMVLYRDANRTQPQEVTPTVTTDSNLGRTLVVYYSATGYTEKVAQFIATATEGDIFKLEPVELYTSEDLNWTNENSRVVREHDNPSEREVALVSTTVPNWESYDTVFIGYPIWWGMAAWPVNGFVRANNFTNKTVVPFCTSSSSGIGESGILLRDEAGTGNWQEGRRFNSGASEEEVQSWIVELKN